MPPTFYELCGTFDGLEAAGKWLRMLAVDFRTADMTETPELFFEAVDLRFTKDASDWVEANPQYLLFTEQVEEPKARDVEDFKKAVQARFPAKSSMIRGEDFVEEDPTNLKQGEQEDLPTFYGWALDLLRRSNTKDTPLVGSPPLSAAERFSYR
ncbi:hypothetical protein K3495_g617 [Podosphaera aphanis]|nr:hypothetical protein K3495_g617 [Podosphaera aphanis]